jgi:hypothetical protein
VGGGGGPGWGRAGREDLEKKPIAVEDGGEGDEVVAYADERGLDTEVNKV